MGLFSKKKKKEEINPTFPPSTLPIEQVAGMMQQGYTNEQIVQTLQAQGYSPSQIYDSINQASMTQIQDYGYGDRQYQQPAIQQQQPKSELNEEKVQEVAEAIIEEKWDELAKDIKAVIEWKNKTESKITQLEQEIDDLKTSINSLNVGIFGKISQYDKNLMEVGVEIKAMEKVFQNILPSLTENVAKLERMTKGKSAK